MVAMVCESEILIIRARPFAVVGAGVVAGAGPVDTYVVVLAVPSSYVDAELDVRVLSVGGVVGLFDEVVDNFSPPLQSLLIVLRLL